MAFLDKTGLERLWAHIIDKFSNKVDKIEGKGLSTNDYSNEEKTKLANAVLELESKLDIVETGSAISANSDLNEYKTPGNYICVANNTSSLANCPVTSAGFKLIVIVGYSAERKHQFLLRGATSDLYYRMFNSTDSVWTKWINLNTSLTGLGITATAEELNYMDGVTSNVQTQLNAKVPTSRTVNGKVLSGNITLSAEDIGADASGSASAALTTAKAYTDAEIGEWVGDTTVSQQITTAIADKVDKVSGKGLSTNDYTTAEKTKLSGIASNAEVNQNAFGIIKTKSGSVNATVNADAKVDTVTFEAGDNITLITNESTGVIKIVGADAPEAPEASLEALGISATAEELNRVAGVTSNIQTQLNAKVPTSRTVNGKALSGNITLSASDVGAVSEDDIGNYLNVTEIGTVIVANTDLNTLTTPGSYSCVASNTSSLTNCPFTSNGFKLIVIAGYDGLSDGRKHQFILRGTTSNLYYRMYNSTGETWTDWVNLNTTLSSLGITATATELNYVDGVTSNIQAQLNGKAAEYHTHDYAASGHTHSNYVPTTRTVNGKALSSNISLTASDVGAAAESHGTHVTSTNSTQWNAAYTHSTSAHAPSNAQKNSDITKAEIEAKLTGAITSHTHSYVPTTRTVNGKALSSNITLSASDVGAAATSHGTHVEYGTSASALGTSSAGSASTVSRSDHVHAMPTLSDLGITATAAELNYVDGVTSAIQTQLNNRLNIQSAGTTITADSDLNDYMDPGVYTAVTATTGTLSNCPFTSGGVKLVVMNHYTTNRKCQFLFHATSTQAYYRVYNGSSWYAWTRMDNPGIVYSSSEPTGSAGMIWLKPIS